MSWRDLLTPEQERALEFWRTYTHKYVLPRYYDEDDE